MISDVFYIWTGKIAYVLLGILAASIAGTLSYLVWLFLERRTAKFHVRISMLFLRMVLACYLIPIIPFVVYAFLKGLKLGEEILLIPTPMATILLIVVPVCLVGLIVAFVNKYWEHRKKSFLCWDNVPITDEKYLAMLDKWCKKLKIRKKVYLNSNEFIRSPAILYNKGYQIVLPTYMENDKEINMAILHELVHLKHGDLRTKHIGDFTNALHSFNPVTSKLREDIEKWAEVDCDRDTCEIGKDEFERNEYFDCLMDLRVRSQMESQLREICGLVENQDLVAFRINIMHDLKREEMTTPLAGYVVTLFFLVILTVGSFKVSYSVYKIWIELFVNFQEETLDNSSPKNSTMELFTGTELVYSDEEILNQDDGLNFKIDSKETWIFDVSEKNVNRVLIGVMCDGGHFLVGGIGEDEQVISIESSGDLVEWLMMSDGNIQQIFLQNPGEELIEIELLVGQK